MPSGCIVTVAGSKSVQAEPRDSRCGPASPQTLPDGWRGRVHCRSRLKVPEGRRRTAAPCHAVLARTLACRVCAVEWEVPYVLAPAGPSMCYCVSIPPNSPSTPTTSVRTPPRDHSQRLAGGTFSFSGSFSRTQADLAELISAHGGQVSAKVHPGQPPPRTPEDRVGT